MSLLRHQIRRGAYHDSIVLMRLQTALAELPGVLDAGVVMGTEANLEILAGGGLKPADLGPVAADDLVAVVRAASEGAAEAALARLDELLARRRGEVGEGFRPRSLATALQALPEARWVLISVPGRWAAGVADDALEQGRHVFLFSDNVPLEREVALKRKAAGKALLVMGPDCGTARVGGLGLGFANRVRRGVIGLVAASGTGLQAVTSRIHALGEGVSHAFGTGGRDLSSEVGAVTALQTLDLLARDPETRVVVLVSKPPAAEVAARVLAAARACGKPVVVDLIGHPAPFRVLDNLHLATSLGEAATLAVELARSAGRGRREGGAPPPHPPAAPRGRYLRGLFSGGTLAQEALLGLSTLIAPVASNLKAPGSRPLPDPTVSHGHTIVDLGADELTAGRPHPMMDPSLLVGRLEREAADPQAALLLFDVVLGDGAHPDPASVIAPALRRIRSEIRPARDLELVALVLGTEEDPQGLDAQIEGLTEAGATVFHDLAGAVAHTARHLGDARGGPPAFPPVPLDVLRPAPAAINIGVEIFYDSLLAQGAEAIHVDWRPPAGGDEKLAAILARMKSQG